MPQPGSITRAIRATYKVVIVDLLVLLALYYVLQDLQWRTNYAASPHAACGKICEYSPSFGYSFLTRFFTMAGNGVSLTSPPTLDWVQLLALVLIAANGWFIYDVLRSRRSRLAATSQA
jgi:hypothetical protein